MENVQNSTNEEGFSNFLPFAQPFNNAYLQISTFAVGWVHESADFELLEGEPKDPVFGDALDALEAIPAGERSVSI